MTHGDILLCAIRDDPGDDLPRLAYADLLEETGGDLARAEFIRLQIRQAIDPNGHGFLCLPERLCKSCHRQQNLLRQFGRDWLPINFVAWKFWVQGETIDIIDTESLAVVYHWIFRRGFPCRVNLPHSQWPRDGPGIVTRCPLERVELSDRTPFYDGRLQYQSWGWRWHLGDCEPGMMAATLDRALWDCLAGGVENHGDAPSNWKEYPTREAAMDALSDACLLLARDPKRRAEPTTRGRP